MRRGEVASCRSAHVASASFAALSLSARELSDRAVKADYVVARVTAHEGMAKAIIEQFQLNGSAFFKDDKRKLTGVTAGALGFTIGLTFSEAADRILRDSVYNRRGNR